MSPYTDPVDRDKDGTDAAYFFGMPRFFQLA